MKIVFLDFDGVLNSHAYLRSLPAEQTGGVMGLDPQAVARLNRLVAQADAKVVVSSSWRHGRTRAALTELLRETGFTGEVVGMTPDFVPNTDPLSKRHCGERGDEIQAWTTDAPRYGIDVESFIILDDGSDMAHLSSRLVRTTFADGLLDEHVDRAVAMLVSAPSLLTAPSLDDVARDGSARMAET